jgi:hypothetical protein
MNVGLPKAPPMFELSEPGRIELVMSDAGFTDIQRKPRLLRHGEPTVLKTLWNCSITEQFEPLSLSSSKNRTFASGLWKNLSKRRLACDWRGDRPARYIYVRGSIVSLGGAAVISCDAHRYGFRRTDPNVTSFIHPAVLLNHALLQKKRVRSRLAVGRAWTGTVSPAYSITSESRANVRFAHHSGHKIISAFLEYLLILGRHFNIC